MQFSKIYKPLLFLFILFFVFANLSLAQVPKADSSKYITLPASNNYYKNSFYKFLWGEHYRKEWHTPVTMRKVYLDTLLGGLNIYKTGGGRQTKSLRVTDKKDHEYVFRSLDKSFGKALPPITEGTFIEKLADDQVTLAHPYAALVVAPLAEAADIYHASPILYYVPKQPALGKYNDSMGNLAYLFEQRPDENWSTNPDFGNSRNIVSTDKMLEKTLNDQDDKVDQYAFVRARLFDLFIGDGGRHEDQWRWATFKDGKKTLYKPIPRDRDNAFAKYEGFLLKRIIGIAHAKHLQSFDYTINNIRRYNFPARHLDHHFLNELTLQDWLYTAEDLQNKLTDKVIDSAVKAFPPEVYPISGPEIAAKLKSRRDHLPEFAKEYFLFLSQEVEVTASEKDDEININRLSDTSTQVDIYKITKKGNVKENPYYHRIFDNRQTKEVRIYGLGGEDQWNVKGSVDKSIKFRLIGGADKDIYIDSSHITKNGKRTIIYDDFKNEINSGSEVQTHLSKDSSIHAYNYEYFQPNLSGFVPLLFYNNADRIYVGLAYHYLKHQWRKTPYGFQQYIDVKYSLAQDAISSTYTNRFSQLLGKWDLVTYANYDHMVWTNFFGLGNETIKDSGNADFYRFRAREFTGKLGLERVINNKQRFTVNGTFNTMKFIEDKGRFLSKAPVITTPFTYTGTQRFAGAEFQYLYQDINDSTLPTKGFNILGNVSYSQNVDLGSNHVENYSLESNIYLPLSKKISYALRAGGSTLTGNPQFFQYNNTGTTNQFRGFERNRFYGESVAYAQNDLRFITPIHSYLLNGRIGFFTHYDVARVWLEGEDSNKWHSGYGGGIIISPFNFITVQASYSVSKNESSIGLKILKSL